MGMRIHSSDTMSDSVDTHGMPIPGAEQSTSDA